MNEFMNKFFADVSQTMRAAQTRNLELERLLAESGLVKLLTVGPSKIIAEKPEILLPSSVWNKVDLEELLHKNRQALEIYIKKEESSVPYRETISKSAAWHRRILVEYISDEFKNFRTSRLEREECREFAYELRSLPGIFVYVGQKFERAASYEVNVCVLFGSNRKKEQNLLLNRHGLCTQFINEPPRHGEVSTWSISSDIFYGHRRRGSRERSDAFAFGYFNPFLQKVESEVPDSGFIALKLYDSLA